MRYFVMASQALLTTSRRKMSLSEYSQRLITGMIFSASIETLPLTLLWQHYLIIWKHYLHSYLPASPLGQPRVFFLSLMAADAALRFLPQGVL